MQILRPSTQIILDTRRKKIDGSYPVKIRVTYLRQQQYYTTGITLTQDLFDAVMANKVKQVYRETRITLDAKLQRMREVIDNIPHFTFALLDSQVKQGVKDVNDIFPFFEEMYQKKYQQGKIKTALTYRTAIRSLQKFKKKIGFYDITPSFLMEYEKYMTDQGFSLTTVGINLRNLRALYNKAINERIVSDAGAYPFKKGKYSIPNGRNIKKALEKVDLKKIIELNHFDSLTEEWARDMWLLLFFCNGVNPTDLFRIQKTDLEDDYITIVRKKTEDTAKNALPVVIYVRQEAKSIIKKWTDPKSSYLIKGLRENSPEEQICKDVDQFVKLINRYMKRIAEKLCINNRCTCYTARHSFAQAMKNAGVSIEVISESLGHTNLLTTRSYLNSFRRETIKKAAENLL